MSVTIQVRYLGELRCEAQHGPSGSLLRTDAPTDNQGRGELFSPTDMVAVALATCMLTLMGIAAQRRGIDIDGATAQVEKRMIADPDRRIAALPVTITLPRALGTAERALLERAALTCPVSKSLDPRVEKPVEFRYPTGS